MCRVSYKVPCNTEFGLSNSSQTPALQYLTVAGNQGQRRRTRSAPSKMLGCISLARRSWREGNNDASRESDQLRIRQVMFGWDDETSGRIVRKKIGDSETVVVLQGSRTLSLHLLRTISLASVKHKEGSEDWCERICRLATTTAKNPVPEPSSRTELLETRSVN